MKKNLIIMMSIIITTILTSCTDAENKEMNIDINALSDELVAVSEFKEELISVEKDILENKYFLEIDKIVNYKFMIAPVNIEAEMIAIFELVDEDSVESFKASLNMIIEDLKFSFEGYIPTEFEIVEDAVTESNGKYVVLAISQNIESMEDIIEDKLNI